MKSRKTLTTSRSAVVRAPANVFEVLDRVLDRGIVIDAWLRVSLVGLTLVDVDARVVVASIRTYVRDGEAVAGQSQMSRTGPVQSPAKRRVARASRPAAGPRPPRPKVMLRCNEGCTFLRASRPSTVRCASDRTRACAVTPV
jgi:hypothetical protein